MSEGAKMVQKIVDNKETIIKGEIGALLHDIGKLHPNFIKQQSLENVRGLPHHARGVDDLDADLFNVIKNIKIKFDNDEKSIYDLIKDHHDANGILLKELEKCDRMDSADDKGVVRKKQPLNNTKISTPFGYEKETVDITCLEKRFRDLEIDLKGLLELYINGKCSLECLIKTLKNTLRSYYSHALGETRIPANDVTLWDHSHSTAALFKSKLVELLIDGKPSDENHSVQWRIFGIGWDGIGFINKGKKIADILERNKIIEEIKNKLKDQFECQTPIGNVIYEDNNGIYFTFPAITNDGEKLALKLSESAFEIINSESNNELWPFFLLSDASRSLASLISGVLKQSAKLRKIPKSSPALYPNGKINAKEEYILPNPCFPDIEDEQDICPVCRMRSKKKDAEECKKCNERRSGRLSKWFEERENTIWTTEVADRNNRVALVTLKFDLDKWLDGSMVQTIYSQTFQDWFDKEKLQSIQDKLKKINEEINSLDTAIQNMAKASDPNSVSDKIRKKENEKRKFIEEIEKYNFTLNPDKETAYKLLELFLESKDEDNQISANILDSFFEEVNITQNNLTTHISNIEQRIESELTVKKLANYLFTQNPSPARLYRIWNETQEYFDQVITEMKERMYENKSKRLIFSVDESDLDNALDETQDKNKPFKKNTDKPCIIKIEGLKPDNILLLQAKNGEFYTIESLEKYEYNTEKGFSAVKSALDLEGVGFHHLAYEDEPNKNLLKNNKNNTKLKAKNIRDEDYYPFISITSSPLMLRMIVPAMDSARILKMIQSSYQHRFEKVIGKLPLDVGLIVSKRKFPLYVMLDAGDKILEGKYFKKPVMTEPWWDVCSIGYDDYHKHYPVNTNDNHTLDNLFPISKGKIFSLLPGYFDFDLLLGTSDRYKINYSTTKNNQKRTDEEYKLFSGRPYYFHQITEMIELWELLSNNISQSQINNIEQTLLKKFREWKMIDDPDKKCVERTFIEAVLGSSYSSKWNDLSNESRTFLIESSLNGLLIDTISFFRHVIKLKEDE